MNPDAPFYDPQAAGKVIADQRRQLHLLRSIVGKLAATGDVLPGHLTALTPDEAALFNAITTETADGS